MPETFPLIDLLLKSIGAAGVLTILVYMIKLSHAWGRMEEKVERFTSALEKIDVRLDAQNDKLGKLAMSVGILQGEHHGGVV